MKTESDLTREILEGIETGSFDDSVQGVIDFLKLRVEQCMINPGIRGREQRRAREKGRAEGLEEAITMLQGLNIDEDSDE